MAAGRQTSENKIGGLHEVAGLRRSCLRQLRDAAHNSTVARHTTTVSEAMSCTSGIHAKPNQTNAASARSSQSSFPSELELATQSVPDEVDLIELLHMNAIAYFMATS